MFFDCMQPTSQGNFVTCYDESEHELKQRTMIYQNCNMQKHYFNLKHIVESS